MPRTARASAGGYCYHVLNRGNGRAEVFHKADDYTAFLEMVAEASARRPMRVLGFAVMPNHFHLVLRPYEDGDLSRWMQWLLTTHVRRYRRHYGSSGHVWQGRFKAFPCQDGTHLLTLLRYVERNALRAGLVSRADLWPYGSLYAAVQGDGPITLEPVPERGPLKTWVKRVNQAMNEAELAALRHCITRGTPFGEASWVQRTASALGLESTLRPRGRPRKIPPSGPGQTARNPEILKK
jgi:putative transposase